MVSKKSFTLLVDTKTIPIFVVVPIYFVHDCSYFFSNKIYNISTYLNNETIKINNETINEIIKITET